jgi:hypothetical protein
MPSFIRSALLCAALICVGVSARAEHGRTPGSFNVSGGAATYTVPIWTPPGPNGMTPSIAVTYSSASSNGVGGMGWQIAAYSAISRCPRTFAQDGVSSQILLNSQDRFCIGGQRLRLSSGTYGGANSVYFTEIADFSRVTAYGSAGNGPQYFIVEAKSGLKYEYGGTVDSRVYPGVSPGPIANTPVRWMLNKVSDRSGNTYVVSYVNTGGYAYPDTIS